MRIILVIYSLLFICITDCMSQKKPLDMEAYKLWRRVEGQRMSEDGKWVTYRFVYIDQEGHDKDVPVTVAPIYKRIPLKVSDDQKRWIGRGEAPVIYLTSTDAIRILEENVGDEGREWLQSASVLTIHPRIQEHLIEEGFKNVELVESHCSGLADKLLSLAEQVSTD